MKIDPFGYTQSTDNQPKTGSNKATHSESFSRVLSDTINDKAADVVHQAVTPNLTPSLPISIDEKHQCIESIQKSFDHLEQYKNMLADPSVNLRSMEPTINRLRRDVNQLGQLMDGTASEGQVKSLMKDTVELISREISRFDQGDYVDPI